MARNLKNLKIELIGLDTPDAHFEVTEGATAEELSTLCIAFLAALARVNKCSIAATIMTLMEAALIAPRHEELAELKSVCNEEAEEDAD